ncbi:MAG: TIGR00289 family protein [Thermoplasmatales archaeon]|nr:TIGR00289 family protein [Thermoplasmatales archaeon]
MKLASLFSGGKDSTYALYMSQQSGHDVKYLVSIFSENKYSYMYHTLNIFLVDMLSEALNIPLIKKTTKGEKEKELGGLKDVLKGLDIDGVVSGAIASTYQKTRIDRICCQLGIKSFAPLWGKNQTELINEIVRSMFEVIITGVSAYGLDETWLGRKIDEKCVKDLIGLNEKYRINVSGEGGEYETLVLDAPNFRKRLVVEDYEKILEKGAGTMSIKTASLKEK